MCVCTCVFLQHYVKSITHAGSSHTAMFGLVIVLAAAAALFYVSNATKGRNRFKQNSNSYGSGKKSKITHFSLFSLPARSLLSLALSYLFYLS